MPRLSFSLGLGLFLALLPLGSYAAPLYTADFAHAALGKLPADWQDLGVPHASPNWGIDGKGLLRVLWKGETGLIVYEGPLAGGQSARNFTDGTIKATFAKTPDPGISFGIAGRVQDAKNFYVVRFSGQYDIALFKVTNGIEEMLAKWVTRNRYEENDEWTLTLDFQGPRITGKIYDAKGIEIARVDALDKTPLASGAVGLQATNFSAAKSFAIEAAGPAPASTPTAEVKKKVKKVK